MIMSSFLAFSAFPYVLSPYVTVIAFCNASSTVEAETLFFGTDTDVTACVSFTVKEVVRITSFPSVPVTVAFTEYVPTGRTFVATIAEPLGTVVTALTTIAEPLGVVVTFLPSLSFTSQELIVASLASTPSFVPITLITTFLASLLSLSTLRSTLLTSILQPFTLDGSTVFTATETVFATTSLPSFL